MFLLIACYGFGFLLELLKTWGSLGHDWQRDGPSPLPEHLLFAVVQLMRLCFFHLTMLILTKIVQC